MPDVEIVAVCDAYAGRAERAKARTNGRAAIVADYKAILANPAIDAVFIVTPDHWHKTMTVEALAAKKDVYLEKPMSYSIEDGLGILEAARAIRSHRAGGQSGRQRPRHGQSARADQGWQNRAGHHGPCRLQPQQRRRRMAVSDSARRRPADGQLGPVHRPGAETPVRPRAILPLALLLGLFRRRRDGPVRPPRLVAQLRHRREDAEGHRRRPARTTATRRRTRCQTRSTRCCSIRRASRRTCAARSTTRRAPSRGWRFWGTRAAWCCATAPSPSSPSPCTTTIAGWWTRGRRPLEKAYYDDPKVQASESPWLAAGHVIGRRRDVAIGRPGLRRSSTCRISSSQSGRGRSRSRTRSSAIARPPARTW